MSEHITHVAVFEDAARLISTQPESFPDVFHAALRSFYDYGIVACGTRGNATFAVPIIEKYRNKQIDDQALAAICGALGWISHRAADSQLNFLADQIDSEANPYYTGQDLKLYYDAIVMHEVYDGGRQSTLSPNEVLSPATLADQMSANPASTLYQMDAFEILYTNMLMRELLPLQQFYQHEPSEGKLAAYVETFDSRSQYYGENLPLYIKAFEQPDPVMVQAVNYRINFYDRNDELIQITRNIQRGKDKVHNITEALAKAEAQSHFAKSLKLNLEHWQYLGLYFDNKISKPELEEKLARRFK